MEQIHLTRVIDLLLFLGTQKGNAQDMARKGRTRGGLDTKDQNGEKNRQARLTANEVLAIRQRYAQGNIYLSQLAEDYHISVPHVSDIVNRKVWRHLA